VSTVAGIALGLAGIVALHLAFRPRQRESRIANRVTPAGEHLSRLVMWRHGWPSIVCWMTVEVFRRQGLRKGCYTLRRSLWLMFIVPFAGWPDIEADTDLSRDEYDQFVQRWREQQRGM
jgi:hypothetical protein